MEYNQVFRTMPRKSIPPQPVTQEIDLKELKRLLQEATPPEQRKTIEMPRVVIEDIFVELDEPGSDQ